VNLRILKEGAGISVAKGEASGSEAYIWRREVRQTPRRTVTLPERERPARRKVAMISLLHPKTARILRTDSAVVPTLNRR
jgi:hypothetical protein